MFKGTHHSNESKQKMRIAATGKHLSDEVKQKVRLASLGRIHSDETKKKIGIASFNRYHFEGVGEKLKVSRLGKPSAFRGRHHSDAVKQKIRLSNINNHLKPRLGMHNSKEMNEKIRMAQLGRPLTEAHKQSLRLTRLNNPEITKKILKKLIERPTNLEKKLIELIQEKSLPIIYVGDGEFFIGSKNPDFILTDKKKAIEVYCRYFKKLGWGTFERYEEERKQYFKKYGFDVLFLNELDLKGSNWKEYCFERINDFISNNIESVVEKE